ncbi:hypothetical protein [Eubacterium sp. 1001713B170207_170306_E7]|uniref:hypothetical protein n=1 Tax=Eubacterium sp. 1001713B170207_170306_E7 TaxID=2787097 RepID=UPI001A9BC331|nr:hypothetical protein [Eubacterium sp. 1001713B170207_170306_E7]
MKKLPARVQARRTLFSSLGKKLRLSVSTARGTPFRRIPERLPYKKQEGFWGEAFLLAVKCLRFNVKNFFEGLFSFKLLIH